MLVESTNMTTGSKEEMLALREEMAVLRKEFEQLLPPQMVRQELDLLKSEVESLAGKVKELEKYLQGGVKLGVLGLVKSASDEGNTPMEAGIVEGGRVEKEKEGLEYEIMKAVKVKRSNTSTSPMEGTKEVEVNCEVNNNVKDGTAKSSTLAKTKEDSKKVEKIGEDASGEASVLIEKRAEEVKAERSTTSTRPEEGTKQPEKTVKTSLPTMDPAVVLDFVSVKPKMVKKKSK